MTLRMHPTDERDMPAPYVAALIKVGWLDEPPLEWTRSGVRAMRLVQNPDGSYNGRELMRRAIERLPPGSFQGNVT